MDNYTELTEEEVMKISTQITEPDTETNDIFVFMNYNNYIFDSSNS